MLIQNGGFDTASPPETRGSSISLISVALFLIFLSSQMTGKRARLRALYQLAWIYLCVVFPKTTGGENTCAPNGASYWHILTIHNRKYSFNDLHYLLQIHRARMGNKHILIRTQ